MALELLHAVAPAASPFVFPWVKNQDEEDEEEDDLYEDEDAYEEGDEDDLSEEEGGGETEADAGGKEKDEY